MNQNDLILVGIQRKIHLNIEFSDRLHDLILDLALAWLQMTNFFGSPKSLIGTGHVDLDRRNTKYFIRVTLDLVNTSVFRNLVSLILWNFCCSKNICKWLQQPHEIFCFNKTIIIKLFFSYFWNKNFVKLCYWDDYLIWYFLKNQLVFGTNWSHYLKACFLPTIHSHLASTPHWGQIWRPAIVNKTKRLSLIFLKYDKWQEEEKLFGIFFDPIFFLRFLCEIIQQ